MLREKCNRLNDFFRFFSDSNPNFVKTEPDRLAEMKLMRAVQYPFTDIEANLITQNNLTVIADCQYTEMGKAEVYSADVNKIRIQ